MRKKEEKKKIMSSTLMVILGLVIGYMFVGKYVTPIVSDALNSITSLANPARRSSNYYYYR